ncbi:MAG: hypothetical protein HYZ42_00655 [Bacteroidetes bacterium]|nr:hypothetical protein [Bacteroidota bacterium]
MLFGNSTGAGSMDSLTVTNNIIGHDDYITNRGAYGVLAYYVNVGYFNNNKIYNLISNSATSWVNPYGIQVQLVTPGGLIEIKKNNIYSIRYERVTASGFGNAGIYVDGSTAGSNIKIHNNTISDLNSSGNTIGAVVGSGIKGISVGGTLTSNVEIYNNSISLAKSVIRSGATNDKSAAIFIDNVADSIFLVNNSIFDSIQNSSGIDTAFALYSLAAPSKFKTINYNNYYVNGTRSRLAYFSGSGSTNTIGGIQAITGQDANSISSDPKYNYYINLRPQSGSPLYQTGTAIGSITDDLLGTLRSGTPSIGCYEDSGDFVAPIITYTAFTNSSNVPTYNITTNVKAIDPLPGTPAVSCRIYYRKFTNANTWGGTNDNTTDGWKYVEGTASGLYFNFGIDHSLLYGGVTSGDQIYYFVVAQDGKATPNVSYTKGTLTSTPTSYNLTASEFPLTGLPDSYLLSTSFSGCIDVGPSYAFKNLTGDTGVFKFLNQNVLGGDVRIRIRENTFEPGTYELAELSDSLGNSRVFIYPDGNTTRVLSGYVADAMIRINGADRVIFDGRDTGTYTGQYLLFRNKNTSNPTMKLIGDASFDTIQYCQLEGNCTASNTGMLYLGAGISFGVDYITVTNNSFSNRSDSLAASLPNVMIFSEGASTSILNNNNNITNNNFSNFSGVDGLGVRATTLGNGGNWNISSNSFFYNYGTNSTTSQIAISFFPGGLSGGNIINNNYIGGSSANCGGSRWINASTNATHVFGGIRTSMNSVKSTIAGNTIKNISLSTSGTGPAFTGLVVSGSGTVDLGANGNPNIIGDIADTQSVILNTSSQHNFILSTSINDVNVRYNEIYGVKMNTNIGNVIFIQMQGGGGTDTVDHNTIGSTIANGLNYYGSGLVYCINAQTTPKVALFDNNTIRGMYSG